MAIDTTLLFDRKAERTYHILSKPGDWRYERTEGQFKSTKYIFSRPHSKDPNRRVELAISEKMLHSLVFEITPPMLKKLDLSKLEAFRYQ